MASAAGDGADLNVHLVRLESEGNVRWDRTYPSDDSVQPYAVRATSDGGFVLASAGYVTLPWEGYAYAAKIAGNGELEWERRFTKTIEGRAGDVEFTGDGGYVLAGDASRPIAGYQALLMKLDGLGNEVWRRYIGNTASENWEGFSALRVTTDGGYVATGRWDWQRSSADVYLVTTDADGETGPLPQ